MPTFRAVLGLLAAVLLQGCGFTVTPPADPAEPVSVFIADHGIHTSLLLPRPSEGPLAVSPAEGTGVGGPGGVGIAGTAGQTGGQGVGRAFADGLDYSQGRIAQYAYSRFDWAAKDQDQWYRSLFAIMVPGDGTIGTRDLPGPPSEENLRRQFDAIGRHPPLDRLYELRVERRKRDELLAELDRRWAEQSGTAVFNQKRGISFVRDTTKYSLGHNCNHVLAGWVRALGCAVSGAATTAEVTVRDPGGKAAD